MEKQVFVTVGTTEFDSLVSTICKTANLLILKKLGYSKLVIQIGKGKYEPNVNIDGIQVDYFRYKESIIADIRKSDLIISHAGAGTCLEVLRLGKLLLAVINEELMDNHQFELAEEFSKNGYLFYTTCENLNKTLKTLDINKIQPYPTGNVNKFVNYLNKSMGFNSE